IKWSSFHSTAAIITKDRGPLLLAPKLTLDYATSRCWAQEFAVMPSTKRGLGQFIQSIIDESGINEFILGIEGDFLSIKDFEELKKGLPKVELRDVSHKISMMKAEKLDEEIEALRKAAAIADKAMYAAF
ncbi:MAG: aminopeptidase P family N-terminal domain-containing protein, partial [Candidatus Hodarchaeota archaeon]